MKAKKIKLISTSILLLVGILLLLLSFMLVQFDFHKFAGRESYSVKRYTVKEDVESIIISEREYNITVIPSSDSQIHITYLDGNKQDHLTVEQRGKEVKWEREVKPKISLNPFLVRPNRQDTVLEIPEGISIELLLKNITGVIKINNVALKSTEIESTSGKIEVDNVRVKTISIRSTSGDIVGKGTTADKILLKETTGNIDFEVQGKEEEYSLQSSSLSGNVNIESREGLTQKTLTAKSISGDIRVSFSGLQE